MGKGHPCWVYPYLPRLVAMGFEGFAVFPLPLEGLPDVHCKIVLGDSDIVGVKLAVLPFFDVNAIPTELLTRDQNPPRIHGWLGLKGLAIDEANLALHGLGLDKTAFSNFVPKLSNKIQFPPLRVADNGQCRAMTHRGSNGSRGEKD